MRRISLYQKMCFHSSLSLQSWTLRESARQDETGLIIRQDFKGRENNFSIAAIMRRVMRLKWQHFAFAVFSCMHCLRKQQLPIIYGVFVCARLVGTQEECHLLCKQIWPSRLATGVKVAQGRVIFIPSTIIRNILLIWSPVMVAASQQFFY